MKVGDICSRNPVVVAPLASLREAALLMRNQHVGALIVAEGEPPRPLGVLTDRDIVVAAIAVPGARPEGIRAQDAMSRRLWLVYEDQSLLEAAALMREHAVRRLPVLTRERILAGIVTLDDVLQVLATELADLGEALRWSRKRELAERKRIETP